MAGAQPPAPPKEPPLEPPLLGDIDIDGEDQSKLKVQDVLRSSKSGCLTKSMSESYLSDCSLQEALHEHHEVMQQWMARVEKQMQLLRDSTETKLEDAVAKLTEVVNTRRKSRPQLTHGSSGSMLDELGKKVIERSTSFGGGGGSRSLEDLREVQNAAKKAFLQDIGPARAPTRKASKTGAKPDVETETEGARERRGSPGNSLSVVIPDLPGAPVFDAHGGEKRATSIRSFEKPVDAVPSQSSISPHQCRLPSRSSNPERQFDALLSHPSARSMPERPTDDTSRPNSASRICHDGSDATRVFTAPLHVQTGVKDGDLEGPMSPKRSLQGSVDRAASHRSSCSARMGQSESDGEDKDSACKTRSRRKSVEMLNVRRVVSSGNLTDVFKERERALTAHLSPHNEADLHLPAEVPDDCWASSNAEAGEDWSRSWWLLMRPLDLLVSRTLSKTLGLLPLFPSVQEDDKSGDLPWEVAPSRCVSLRQRFFHCVGASYHFLVVFFALAYVVISFLRIGRCQVVLMACARPGMASDAAIAVGALGMLLCWGGINYKERMQLISQSLQDLVDALEKKSLDKVFEVWSCSDSLIAVICWALILAGRWTLLYLEMAEDFHTDPNNYSVVFHELGFFVSSGVVILTCFWQVRTSHAMTLIVNSWVEPFLSNQVSCDHLRCEWRTVSGLFRKTSRTFQLCSATIGFTSVLLILCVLYDFREGHAFLALPNIALGLCLPGVLLVHASTTTACKRLPSLVMLWEPSEDSNERDYIDLALFVSMSECGFFIWDTCLTLGLVQKFIYFTVAMAGTLGFQSGVLKLA
ncbi:Lrguk [Symbiodinium sp. CCMP2592]|nr:Lrguk [Symbiodinium sp. CCMP2592]